MNMDQYIGRLLDNRYEILEIIGTGGMAVVYKARCHRLNRLVAIKILKDEFARDEEFVRRFHAEGEAVAMLSHPNIVQVFDVSSTDSANFIVMELVDGISMKQYMEKKGVLNWKETLHFSIQIAKGLEHAHSRGIVHRDIKPHNVMVLKNGSVKVMDFGIARVMSKSNTLPKEALGSVHYISPEQAKGGYTDNRSDLYSLSVVMYEMMTGRPPYDGESPVSVAIQHINGGAPMPTTLNPNIPAAMEQIIMHGMALEPKDRYASATEMLRDMDEFRKDPAIVFQYRKKTVSDDTQTVHLGELTQKPKTTAERVARSKGDKPPVKVPDSPTSKVRTGTGRVPAVEQGESRTATASRDEQIAAQRRRRRREMEEQEHRSRMTTMAIVACSAVAVIAIVIFLIALFSGALFNQRPELVEVPSLVGQTYKDLPGYTDIVIGQGVPEYHEEYEKGQIIHQEPSGGSKVKAGTEITVIVSLGPQPTVSIMENLCGQDLEDAKNFLTTQGMNPLAYSEFSEDVPEGQVIRTNPAQGTELTPGQKVEIYYSAGPLIKTAKVPDLVGLDYTAAMKRLDDLGFKNVDVEHKADDADKGEVIKQSVEKNTELDITEKIVLTISKGPDVVKANVPNVEGLSLKQAIDRLHDYGFDNIREEYVQSNAPKDEVIGQSVEGGKQIDVLTQIVLTISEGPEETEAPTTEAPETEPQVKTIRMTITLPEKEEAYVLSLRQGNQDVTEPATILPGTADITLELTGTGIQTYDLYINDEFYDSINVDFSK